MQHESVPPARRILDMHSRNQKRAKRNKRCRSIDNKSGKYLHNEEEAKKCLREESYEEGFAEGIEKGIKEGFTEGRLEGLAKGEKNIKDILTWLNKQNRSDDIIKAISDDSYMEKLKKEYEESQK